MASAPQSSRPAAAKPVGKKGPRKPVRPIDRRSIKAIGHPLRFEILVALNEGEASPKELAGRLGERINAVAYHVRILEELGAIELVREERRRGAIEHFYRATMRPLFEDREWEKLPVATRRAIFDQLVRHIFRDVRNAQAAGGFDHLQAHVSWTKFELDEPAFKQLAEEVMALLERALELQAESNARRLKSNRPTRTLETELALLQFEPTSRKRRLPPP